MERPPQLGDLLVSVGIISKQQLAQALEYQKENGGLIGQVLVKIGACTEDDVRGALNAQSKRTPLAERLAVIKDRQGESAALPAAETGWRWLDAYERELRRIAKDVQDISQVLGELGLQVEVARKTITANPNNAEHALSEIWEHVKVIVRELDYYSTELAPPYLQEPNILANLKQYASYYRSCYGGNMELNLRADDVRTSRQTALGIFRAIQGLLRGLGSSDGKRDVQFFLSVEDGLAVVELHFERIHTADGSEGDCIGETEERVKLLGGELEYHLADDRVRVICRVPTGPVAPSGSASTVVVS